MLLSRPNLSGDNDELQDAGEDEDHAGEHPDVQVGDVADAGHILADLNMDQDRILKKSL